MEFTGGNLGLMIPPRRRSFVTYQGSGNTDDTTDSLCKNR